MFTKLEPFYNKSIRKTVVAFGSLFNQIYFNRTDNSGNVIETSRVPLIYSPKEKFVQRLKSETSLSEETHTRMNLPRMGFEITGFLYDSQRKLNRLNQKVSTIDGVITSSFIEVPYNINFGLYLFSRNLDDNLQIIEQILPYFAPDFTVTLNMNPLNQKVDVPIVLNSLNTVEDYEGDFDTRRTVNSVFDFTVKTYVYGPIKESSTVLIEDANIRLYDGQNTVAESIKIFDVGYTGDSSTLSGITYYENP
jgi:hypothetical protein